MSQSHTRSSRQSARKPASPALVALAAWLIPGAGYFLLRQRARGLTIGITIITLFALGVLLGGAKIIDAPAAASFFDLQQKPWFIVQALTGIVSVATAWLVNHAHTALPVSHARLSEIGTLYTAVAGMLNLLAIIDASSRAVEE